MLADMYYPATGNHCLAPGHGEKAHKPAQPVRMQLSCAMGFGV